MQRVTIQPIRQRVLSAVLAWIGVSTVGADACATLEFAQVMMAPPYEQSGDCRLCHAQVIGSAGTANQPFAKTLQRMGISGTSSGRDLERVLERLGDEDSDGDGSPDIEELLTGGDPNEEGCGSVHQELVYEYGCANLVGARPTHAWLGVIVVGLFVLLRRARVRALTDAGTRSDRPERRQRS